MAGLHSLQAVNHGKEELDVTVYRASREAALSWKDTLAGTLASFSGFMLREDEKSWQLYDGHGRHFRQVDNVTNEIVSESSGVISVDRGVIESDVRDLMMNDDLVLIGCAEGHAGASAADHSNFSVMCRKMIIEAKPADLRHIMLVESRRWSCRVIGMVVDLSRLSGEMTDVFIDRSPWLRQSWPLVSHHHADTLADRLAKARANYTAELLRECSRAAGLGEELALGLQTSWALAGQGPRYRFAQRLVSVLSEGLIYAPATAEKFSDDIIAAKGHEVVRGYQKLLRA